MISALGLDDVDNDKEDSVKNNLENEKMRKGKLKRVKVVSKKKIICPQCEAPINIENKILRCKYCGKNFCEDCEKKIQKEDTYFDGFETRKLYADYPLCEKCYESNLSKQKELFTMHRRFLQLRKNLPSEPDVWFSTAEQFKESGLYDLARLCFNEVINIDETYILKIARAWESEGNRLMDESQYSRAIECLDESLSLDMSSESAWLKRSNALYKQNKLDEALVSLEKVLKINENNLEALCQKGLLLAKMNDQKGSRKCFIKAVNINPASELVWVYKLRTHSLLNEFLEVIKSADYVLGINPNNDFAWQSKWMGLINLEEYYEALKCTDELIKIQPMNPVSWKNKGDTLLKIGEYENAIMIYNKVLALDPEGNKIDTEEVKENIKKSQNKMGGYISLPDSVTDGTNMLYEYIDYQDIQNKQILDITIEKPTKTNVIINEKTPNNEINKLEFTIDIDKIYVDKIIHDYWVTTDLKDGDKISDIDDKEFLINGTEQITTPFGPKMCWKLEYNDEKGENKIKIISWFDSHTGLLIKKTFNKRIRNKVPEHWVIKLQDSNIRELKLEVPPVPPVVGVEPPVEEPKLEEADHEEKLVSELEKVQELKEVHLKKLEEERLKFEEERKKFFEDLKDFELNKEKFEKDKESYAQEKQRAEQERKRKLEERQKFKEKRKEELRLKKQKKLELEKQEKLKFEEERRQFEEEKQKMKDELRRIEKERLQLEEKIQKAEEEKAQKIEEQEEREQEQQEKLKISEVERLQFEEERKKFEEERQKIQDELTRFQQEKQQFEEDRHKIEEEQHTADEERRRKLEERKKLKQKLKEELKLKKQEKRELEKQKKLKLEEEKRRLEEERKRIQEEKRQIEQDKRKLEEEEFKATEEAEITTTESEKPQEEFPPDEGVPEEELPKEEELPEEIVPPAQEAPEEGMPKEEEPPEEIAPPEQDTPEEEVSKEEEMPEEMALPEQEAPETVPDIVEKEVEIPTEIDKKKVKKKKKLETTEEEEEEEERAGEPTLEVEPLQEGLPSFDDINQLYGRILHFDESAEDEKAEIMKTLRSYSKAVKNKLKEFKESGLDISPLTKLFDNAGTKFKNKDFIGSLKLILKIIKKLDIIEQTSIENIINDLSKRIEAASELYPTASAVGALSKARKALANKNLSETKLLIADSERLLDESGKHYLKAKEIIEIVEQRINNVKNSGVNIDEAMKILTEMKELFNAYKYLELPKLKQKCLIAVEESRKKYSEVLNKIGLAQKELGKLQKEGVDTSNSVQIIKEAKKMLITGDYEEALQLTNKGIELTTEIPKERIELELKLKTLEEKLESARAQNSNVGSAEQILEKVKEALNNANYPDGLKYASECDQILENVMAETEAAVEEKTELSENLNEISWGECYLFTDTKPVIAFTYQRLLSEQNISSFTISPIPPKELYEKYQFVPDKSIWMNDGEEKGAVSPGNLPTLTSVINKFIENTEMSVILFDGMELLVKNNEIDKSLDFVSDLKKTIKNRKSILILILNKKEISEKDAESIEEICEDLKNVDIKSISKLV